MSAQSNTENVLRSLHVLLSKSEPYQIEPNKVIVDKQQMLDLLSELNECIYEIMEEHEMTEQSRDKAEREFHKKGDQIIWDASRKAEDIYAASVLYMDEALSGIQDIMRKANEAVGRIYVDMDSRIKDEERRMKENQSELKSQLQDLVDTEKYLRLIEDRNREIERERSAEHRIEKQREKEPSIYANRQTQIKINQEYLDRLGLSVVEDAVPQEYGQDEEDEELRRLQEEIHIDLDSDYFQWKEAQASGMQVSGWKEARASGMQAPGARAPERGRMDGTPKRWKNLKKR